MEVLKVMFSIDKTLVTTSKNKFNENTPLHLASEAGHVDAVKIMIENGVSAVDENLDGFTPVQISARCGHGDVFEVFANSGRSYYYFYFTYATRMGGFSKLANYIHCFGALT